MSHNVELVIFIGLQAAGKSSFYRARFEETHVLISKDLLRNNRSPERRQRQLLVAALTEGYSVVVDNTNVTVTDRASLIEIGRAQGAACIGYFFETTVSEARLRNSQREGRARVPNVAIYATAKRLEEPSYGEGFDALYRVRIVGDGAFQVTSWGHEKSSDPIEDTEPTQ